LVERHVLWITEAQKGRPWEIYNIKWGEDGDVSKFPSEAEICGGYHNFHLDCDMKYNGSGPAWEDMLDFVRDEEIWLRKYMIAWHIATENGA